ncbi:MAG: carbamoyl-phosphate synthase large subunit [Solirubrobacteraceae bacterium]
MPRRADLRKILILGSGPIVIGQAAEFDYSGVQACKVLLEEGFQVVLVNSNPATIMTDPEFADRTYIEPLLPGPVSQVIARERPDALLPTLGGQTALNLAKTLAEDGTLDRYGVELIGADLDAIRRAEDRDLFRETMIEAGLRVPRSRIVSLERGVGEGAEGSLEGRGTEGADGPLERALDAARLAIGAVGLPCIVRPAFTLGGRGGGIARDEAELEEIVARGLKASPISQVLLEESVLGWGEFELEVMRDRNDNVVIVCSIENVDPMGVHTGDSVTVAPQQTLTDRSYQALRDQAIAVIRAVGVETGGSNVQFAVNPVTDEIVVIEMNPRVSRSSALASKATGFPIAKIAARLAVGYALEEIPNDITMLTPASFEPTIDYVVVKYPRFAFEKFPDVDDGLETHMKSVGEVMAIGRTFQQAFGKALRSLELDAPSDVSLDDEALLARLDRPRADRYPVLLEALRRGVAVEEVHSRTQVDPWFLAELRDFALDPEAPYAGERTFKSVDTCAAEFAARTPYYYSGWERASPAGVRGEVDRGDRASVVILGSGPNRIGQGIEFDYCCVHAAMTVRESGRDAVMVNCNPETVSTDYDTSDRLYFEPLTLEDVLGVVEVEAPEGVIVQFGGQTPLKLAAALERAGVRLLGTSVDAIDLAEDRRRFGELLDRLGYRAPSYATAQDAGDALEAADLVGYPLLARPSYVLGGRAMEIVYDGDGLQSYLRRAGAAHGGREIYLDRFLERAVEVDVDALCDGETVWIGGIMQHVEEAGIHSGDSACVLPPHSLGPQMLAEIEEQVTGIALALGVVGLLNVQFAVLGDDLYVIEANPRASRTVPFVSKATGVPLAKMACRIMLGEPIAALGLPAQANGRHVSVKEAVLPFDRFLGSDALLGPEMRSTGEVMGIARDFPTAFAKAQAAAGAVLPQSGTVFITVTDRDKDAAAGIAAQLQDFGFRIVGTRGTARALSRMGVRCEGLNKVGDGSPHVVDWIERGDVDLVINTPTGSGARSDGYEIRKAAVARGIPCITTVSGGFAAARAIISARAEGPPVIALQDVHAGDPDGAGAPHAAPSSPDPARPAGDPARPAADPARAATGPVRSLPLVDRR